jgi:hypothetical protein
VVNLTTQASSQLVALLKNLLSVVLVLFPDIFVIFCLQFRWPQ